MKVLIHICAIDEERGIKSTKEEVVEVPRVVIAMHEMFAPQGEDRANKLLNAVALSVYSGAMKEIQASQRNPNAAITQMSETGGKVGGSGGEAKDPLSEALGLDIIQKDVAQQRNQAPPQQARPQQPPPRPTGPGSMGFAERGPINSGPGPGAAGFPTDPRHR